MKKTFAIAAAALIALPAVAQADSLPTITVATADLDLTSSSGLEVLEARIEQAAYSACRTDARELSARNLEQKCRASLREAAMESIAPAQR